MNDDFKKALECINDNIEEEVGDFKDAQLSSKMLDYITSLINTHKCIDKYIYKEKDDDDESTDEDDIEETMIDNRLRDAMDEFDAYFGYKETYEKTHKQSDLDMSHQELNHFLQAIVDIFEEIEESSRDNMEERSLVKAKIKQIYQTFN